MMINLLPLLKKIARQYRLDPTHMHGLSHWGRVLETGHRLSQQEGGDNTVIQLFAIFLDACRLNQAVDPGHGARGAALAEKLLGDLELISRYQLDQLVSACQQHTDGLTSADLTIQVCWDADRLDLARAGIMPEPRYLCTASARDPTMIEWANRRALEDYAPSIVKTNWLPIFDTPDQLR
jgi:uncharacterized protein